jgi:hypothetical protein
MEGGGLPASSRPEVNSAWQLTTPMVPARSSQPIIFIIPRDMVDPEALAPHARDVGEDVGVNRGRAQ